MKTRFFGMAAVVMLTAVTTVGFAVAPVQATYSPFKDNLTIHFLGFPQETMFYASYAGNNGVDISGPDFATTDHDALVVISSNNKLSNGNPNMSLVYPGLFSNVKCAITFTDGPYFPALTYQNGKTPSCPGVMISDIQKDSQYNYSLTITNNEP